MKMSKSRVISKTDGTIDMVYCKGRIETWYTERDGRYYREEESTNVRSSANALRRISREKFEEIRRLIVAGDAT